MKSNFFSKLDAHMCLYFDMDGLLVDTERLHFRAYVELARAHKGTLPWDFSDFCDIAHSSAEGLRKAFYEHLPHLKTNHPHWHELYAQKKQIYLQLLLEGDIQFMPFAEDFLKGIAKTPAKKALITNSPKEQVDAIRKALPTLDVCERFFPRETYTNPKPSPDGYLAAKRALSETASHIHLGFEDSPRGLRALEGAGITPVMIAPESTTLAQKEKQDGTMLFSTFRNFVRSDEALRLVESRDKLGQAL